MKFVIPKPRRSRYTKRVLSYRSSSKINVVAAAARQALYDYSEYFGTKYKGYHLHHVGCPFESILEVFMDEFPNGLPVAYKNQRYEMEEWNAITFAKMHDEILKSHEGCGIAILESQEHMRIHAEMRKENKEREFIKHWVEVLRKEKGG